MTPLAFHSERSEEPAFAVAVAVASALALAVASAVALAFALAFLSSIPSVARNLLPASAASARP
jgi:hypothetical protein